MNRIYSLVWSRSRHQVEVASELARSRGGVVAGGARRPLHTRRHLAALALAVCMALGAVAPLWAQVTVQPGDTVTYTNTDGNVVINQVGTGSTYQVQLNLSPNLSVNDIQVSLLQVGPVKIDTSGIDAGNQKIINVANGSVAAGSEDAVNGGQLNTTNQNVAANTSAITTNTGNIATLQGNALLWNGTAYDAAHGGTAQKIIHVANGSVAAGSEDAVNGGQLNTTNQNVAADTSAIATNTGNIATLQGNALLWNGTAYDAARGGTAQKIVDLKAGTASTDAVNVGQLNAVQSAASTATAAVNSKTDNLGSAAASLFGGGATYNAATGAISNPAYTITTGQGTTTVHSVGDAIALMNGVDPSGGGTVSATGIKYFHANSTAPDSQANGTDSLAIGPAAVVDATSDSGIALGNGAAVGANSENTIAIGVGAHSAPVESPVGSGYYTPVTNAVALGTQAVVSGSNALAMGYLASAGTGGIGVGQKASAGGGNAVAIGNSASAAGGNATAVGNAAQAAGGSAVALGDGAQAATNGTVSIGQQAGQGDAANVAGTYQNLVNIGPQAGQNVNGRENIAIGLNAGSGVDGDQNIALGTAAGSGISGGGRNNVALGFEANQNAGAINNAVAIGATSQAAADGVAVGFAATSTTTGVAIGRQASTSGAGGVALGFNTVAAGNFVALGQNASATPSDVNGPGYLTGTAFSGGAVSVGNANLSSPEYRRIVNVADGAQAHDVVNVEQLRGAQQAVANMVGGGMLVNPDGSYSSFEAIGSNGLPVEDSNGQPVKFQSVSQALGDLASGNLTISSTGSGNIVTFNGAGQIPNVAPGTNGTDAVNVNQLNSVVQANKTHYYGVNSSQAVETINFDGDGATGANASAVGPAAQASGDASLAVGLNTVTKDTATGAVAIGSNVTADGVSSTAIGSNQTYAWDDGAVAIGDDANARDANSIVIGTNAQSNRTNSPSGDVSNSIVVGTNAISSAAEGVAIGLQATASGTRAMAQGHMALASATDAQASGSNAQASGVNASAQGTGAQATAGDAVALGTGAAAGAASSYALGNAAVTAGARSYAIGSGAQTGADAGDSQAIGSDAQTYSSSDIAFGNGAIAGDAINPTGSSNHIAVGTDASVSGDQSAAIGANNTVAQANTFVLGGGVTTTQANSVVLGNQSTDRAATTETTNTFGGIKYSYAGPGASTQGVVSVGSQGGERQVINVAAGKVSSTSTDAVNGSQLYATDVALGDVGNSAVTILGGNAKLSSNGTISMSNIAGTGKATVNDAIIAARTTLAAGTNVASVSQTQTNGAYGYQIDADGTSVSAGSTAVSVTKGTPDANNITNYAVDLSAASKTELDNAVQYDDGTHAGVTLGGTSAAAAVALTNVAAGGLSATSTDAVNGSQLYATNQNVTTNAAAITSNTTDIAANTTAINKGFNVSANGGTTTHNFQLGDTVDVTSGDNAVVTQDASTGGLTVGVNPVITGITSIGFTGGTSLDATGLTIASGPSITTAGINANNTVITGVSPGAVSAASTDAVNGSQLFSEAAAAASTVAAGTNVANVSATANTDGSTTYTVNADGATVSAGSTAVSVTTGTPDANNVTNYEVDLSQATKDTLDNAVQYDDSTHQSVTLGGTGATAPVALTNVAAGGLSATSTDAVNGSQLYATNQAVTQVTNATNNVIHYFKANGSADGSDDASASGTHAVASGPNATASGGASVANGYNAVASGLSSTAVGSTATASGVASVAIGNHASAQGTYGTAAGSYASAAGYASTAFGISASAQGKGSTALGAGTSATGYGSTALGGSASATGERSLAAGSFAAAQGYAAVALGDTAKALGQDSLGLGANSVANHAFDVALGAGSVTAAANPVADTQINGVTYDFAGATPSSVVSVGSVGNERQITNVAAGQLAATSTDAVNGSQLYATNAAIAAVNQTASAGWNLSANGATPASNVQPGDTVDLAPANGNLTVTESDSGTTHSVTVGLSNNLDLGAAGSVAIGSTTVNDTGITIGTGATQVALTGSGLDNGGNVITNVAAGTAQTDAVNVSQLDTAVAGVKTHYYSVNGTATGTNSNYDNDGATGAGALAAGANASAAGKNGTAVGSGAAADGAGSTATGASANAAGDYSTAIGYVAMACRGEGGASGSGCTAVGAKAKAEGTNATALGRGAYTSYSVGATAVGAYASAFGTNAAALGYGAAAPGANSVALGANAVATNANDVALGSDSVTAAANPTAGTVIAGVTYGFAGANPTSVVSVGSAGNERQVTNVAAGRVTATSTDAVNGSQLYSTNTAVDSLQGQIDNINVGGSGMFQVSADSQGSPTPTGSNSAAGGAGARASGSDSLAVGNGSTAGGNQSTAVGAGATATGTGSTAVGAGAAASADNAVAIGAGSVADAANTVSVGSAGNERQITNVAAGTAGTDAVNVNQLRATQQGGVQYDSNSDGTTDYDSVTLNPGGSGPATIHNVAAGVANNDAVNLGQLNTSIAGAVSQANRYTDQKFGELQRNVSQTGNRANAGIASAIAAASLPQPYAPDQSSLGVGLGSFHGEAGIAVGLSKISESGRWIMKANVNSDTRGDTGAGVGVGIVW